MAKSKDNIKQQLEEELKKRKPEKYVLHLYVAGLSPMSQKAIANIKKLCDEHMKGQVELEIQDIYQNPIIAKDGQILAAPTLIKELPPPLRKFVGDMSNTEKLLVGLDLRTKE
ncbi:MAG TPA: thiol-disulfide isomerase [Lentisphaeria bacterium]|nr:MAG: thiol-disulfide isomerase [Lentisphaerae bacterium GWF2_50_93]HCE44195.1 thiol-disulfide isomerase [Lentisphaeria bacterium]